MNELKEDMVNLVKEYAKIKEVDERLLLKIAKFEAFPVDGRRWPSQWLRSLKRMDGFLSSLDEVYWVAFREVGYSDVFHRLDWWNELARNESLRVRRFGRPFGMKKMYWGGRKLKDFFVLGLFRIEDLDKAVGELVKKYDVDVLWPKAVWRYGMTVLPGRFYKSNEVVIGDTDS